MSLTSVRGGAIWWTHTKERQAWCICRWNCVIHAWAHSIQKALYKYDSFPFLSISYVWGCTCVCVWWDGGRTCRASGEKVTVVKTWLPGCIVQRAGVTSNTGLSAAAVTAACFPPVFTVGAWAATGIFTDISTSHGICPQSQYKRNIYTPSWWIHQLPSVYTHDLFTNIIYHLSVHRHTTPTINSPTPSTTCLYTKAHDISCRNTAGKYLGTVS